VSRLITSIGITQLGSVVDGVVVKQYPVRAYAANKVAPVTLTFGWNRPDIFNYCGAFPQATAAVSARFPTIVLQLPREFHALLR
jgi:hypothetical protein